jgi:hypothetical protein
MRTLSTILFTSVSKPKGDMMPTVKLSLQTTAVMVGILISTISASLAQTVFQRTYGGNIDDRGYSIQQTSDGGYIIAGITNSFGAGNYDVYLIKTNSLGDTLWTHTYGGDIDDWGYSVQQTSDGGYIVAGHTSSFGAGPYDVYLIKTNSLGDTLWTRTYGGDFIDWGYSVQQTSDGGYIITGYNYSFADVTDVYLIKTNSVGDTIWTRTYGGTSYDVGYSVQQTSGGGYIIAGYTSSFGAGNYDVYLIKTNSVGDTLWTHTYGGTANDVGLSVQQTSDGGYIIAGITNSFRTGNYDVYLIKTNSNGVSTGVTVNNLREIPSGFVLQQNYPNPFNPSTTIRYQLSTHSHVTLKVYDVLGREVSTLVNGVEEPGYKAVKWDASRFPSGVYYYRLQVGKYIDTKKLLLLR